MVNDDTKTPSHLLIIRRLKEALAATYGIRLISSSILVTYDAKGTAWTVTTHPTTKALYRDSTY